MGRWLVIQGFPLRGTQDAAGRTGVRDYVKNVFEKVGVSSRGELVAKVFADHYAPIPHQEPDAAAG